MNHTIERPGIEITDAPECWNIPEKEPEVYWGVIYRGPDIADRCSPLDHPDYDLAWYGLNEQDAIRDLLEYEGRWLCRTNPKTSEQCTARAIELGREGVGVYTYEGDEKVCVKYWLVGDPLPQKQ